MKAVNLIPTENRKGGGAGAAGRSGGGAYILLGGLALVVVLFAALTITRGKIDDKTAQLDRVTQQAQAAETRAASLSAYTTFNQLRNSRVQTVTSLANSRFDWAHALREVARVLPENAWLTNLTGTVSPSASVGGGGGSGLRAALAVPAIEVTGCTTSQSSVAKMMARMRLIDGVSRVSLETAEKGVSTKADAAAGITDSAAGSPSAGGSASDCRNGNGHFPKFTMVVFYDQAAAPATASAAPATPAATGTTATASATTTTSGAATTPETTTPATTTPSGTTTAPATPTTTGASQ